MRFKKVQQQESELQSSNPYVVKCFIAAGFDTLEVITKMDISNKPGNSIELLEQFISDEYPNNPEYMRSKKFPPGHKIRIQDFVDKVKHLMKPQLGKRTVSGGRSNQPKTAECAEQNVTRRSLGLVKGRPARLGLNKV